MQLCLSYIWCLAYGRSHVCQHKWADDKFMSRGSYRVDALILCWMSEVTLCSPIIIIIQ